MKKLKDNVKTFTPCMYYELFYKQKHPKMIKSQKF